MPPTSNLLIAIYYMFCLTSHNAATLSITANGPTQHQLIVESPNVSGKLTTINVGPETQPTEPFQVRQMQPISRSNYQRESDRSIRVSVGDLRNRYARLENMITVLERLSYAISRPAAVIDAIRLFALAISSVLVTTLNVS